MTIASLSAQSEINLRSAMIAAVDHARTNFDVITVSAVLENIEPGEAAHTLHQLEISLGLAEGTLDPLTAAMEGAETENPVAVLFDLFAATAALAAAGVGHVLNTSQQRYTAARDRDAADPMRRYLADSVQALREAANRAMQTPGSADSRTRQLRRVIGLSPNQGRTLDIMRTAALDHLSKTYGRADHPGASQVKRNLSRRYRGQLSAPQVAMLTKAFATGMTEASADAMLDRHAKALRAHRAKVTAGHAVHATAEAAKLIGWQIAQFFGALPADARRYWRTAGDERVRHSHAAVPRMNPAGVPLSEPFQTPFGPALTPPLEINCRCRIHLRVTK